MLEGYAGRLSALAEETRKLLEELEGLRAAPQKEERYLTTEEVALMLQVSDRWVRNHRAALGGFGTRKMLRFPESAVKRWIERSRKQ